jgi:DNA-binding NarL/FixJ family response regulator
MITVSIIEDDPYFLEIIENALSSSEDIQLISSHEKFEDFIQFLHESENIPRIVISDLGLPEMNGIEGVLYLTNNYPEIEVIILTGSNDTNDLFEALKAGAVSYLTKPSTQSEILEAIKTVNNGGSVMDETVARNIIQYFSNHEKNKNEVIGNLTDREKQVLDCIIEGKSYKESAYTLNVSIDTVRFHIKNLYRKLNVRSKSEMFSKYRGLFEK